MGTNDEQILRTWILVADGTDARLFLSYPGQEGWFELKRFTPPSVEAGGGVAEALAHDLATYLDGELSKQRYEQLILASPPKFLEVLKPKLTKPVEARIVETLKKDGATQHLDDLEERLEQH